MKSIPEICEAVRRLPTGRKVLHLDGEGWSTDPFCMTDDLHLLVEHIEKLEAVERLVDEVIEGKHMKFGPKIRQFFGEYRHRFPKEPTDRRADQNGQRGGEDE